MKPSLPRFIRSSSQPSPTGPAVQGLPGHPTCPCHCHPQCQSYPQDSEVRVQIARFSERWWWLVGWILKTEVLKQKNKQIHPGKKNMDHETRFLFLMLFFWWGGSWDLLHVVDDTKHEDLNDQCDHSSDDTCHLPKQRFLDQQQPSHGYGPPVCFFFLWFNGK